MSRFAVLFALCFTAIPVLGAWNLNLIAQPLRYQLEMEIALCLLLAFTLAPVAARWRRARLLALPIALLALWIFSRDLGYARRLIRPLDISQSAVFRQARWIADHLPGQRIMVAGPATFWFNLFADNPQLSGGHDFSAPNWMQLVAVYTIYSGQNAGAADADISTFWLKVFGCGAIAVSTERPSLTLAHPQKFDGRLPLLWRDSGDSVYLVPQKSASLAHVIPKSAIVVRRPVHGLDLAPVRAYAAALDDPSIPPATLVWQNPDQARITATLSPGQIISVQINYDPGWPSSRRSFGSARPDPSRPWRQRQSLDRSSVPGWTRAKHLTCAHSDDRARPAHPAWLASFSNNVPRPNLHSGSNRRFTCRIAVISPPEY